MLALNGEKDLQVNARENLEAIRKALEKGGNTRVKIMYLAGLNHLFQACNTGTPDEYASIQQTISPQVLTIISDWIGHVK